MLIPFFLTSCALKEPSLSQSATILIKTPTLKFYDKGFIRKYPNHTQVSIFSAGIAVLELRIYENRICKDTFECESLTDFNKKHLSSSYEEQFIKNLFEKNDKTILFEDRINNISIRIIKD